METWPCSSVSLVLWVLLGFGLFFLLPCFLPAIYCSFSSPLLVHHHHHHHLLLLLLLLLLGLRRDDAFVIGMTNQDPRDHALRAVVNASSETLTATINGTAVNIISGQSRATVTPLTDAHEIGGVPTGQGVAGSNRWVSQVRVIINGLLKMVEKQQDGRQPNGEAS